MREPDQGSYEFGVADILADGLASMAKANTGNAYYYDIYKEAGGALALLRDQTPSASFINLCGLKKGAPLVEAYHLYDSMSDKLIGARPHSRDTRTHSIYMVSNNETIVGMKEFIDIKNELTIVRKFLASGAGKGAPLIRIGDRRVRLHLHNIDLMNAGGTISTCDEDIEDRVTAMRRFADGIRELRIELTRRGGLPMTISSVAGDYVQ